MIMYIDERIVMFSVKNQKQVEWEQEEVLDSSGNLLIAAKFVPSLTSPSDRRQMFFV
jgi:hypothetical protein